jgi:diketogulonate reductase-like aldo/keto reductase
LQKYKNMIDAWGGWAPFQELLAVLKQIADKHRVSIANAGVRYILERPAVAGVIVGTVSESRSISTTTRACSVLQLTGRIKRSSKRCSRNRGTCRS